jgi:hypothetical protein
VRHFHVFSDARSATRSSRKRAIGTASSFTVVE